MDQVVTSMQQITDSSRKIADIIGVIDGIAFQTNILALNAAVEGSTRRRAGRAFAVVAGEVRSLAAQRRGRQGNQAADRHQRGQRGIGLAQVAQAGQSMQEIVPRAPRERPHGEITASSTEQRDGISQVNQAITPTWTR